mmetsp:Transcript_46843/g.101713  ORF Transcript_46843/g.101713 Transcript_46843/m.101713 type:complete len:211 (-) Transcript_46843:1016-1648(-)
MATAASLACCTACSKMTRFGRAGGWSGPSPCGGGLACCAAISADSSIRPKASRSCPQSSSPAEERFSAFSRRPKALTRSASASSGNCSSRRAASCSRAWAVRLRLPRKSPPRVRGKARGPISAMFPNDLCRPSPLEAGIGVRRSVTTTYSSSTPRLTLPWLFLTQGAAGSCLLPDAALAAAVASSACAWLAPLPLRLLVAALCPTKAAAA